MSDSQRDYAFFLGGHDLEMVTARDLLLAEKVGPVHDAGLRWGARTSHYRKEIASALEQGRRPVLLELEDDSNLPANRVVALDHHGERAGKDRPTTLHQLFDLLDLPAGRWTRWHELVAANDRGYIPAMVEIGASAEEIGRVRRADRAAQGITEAEERQAEMAMQGVREVLPGISLARLPHNRTAALVDRLQPELGGPGVGDILVVCPDEYDFFGRGALVSALASAFPQGWFGGALPERGFWGHGSPLPVERDVLALLDEASGLAAKPRVIEYQEEGG